MTDAGEALSSLRPLYSPVQKNLSRLDSRARIVLGALAGVVALVILADGVAAPDRYAAYAGVASVSLLVNGLTSRCGIYRALGLSTRE